MKNESISVLITLYNHKNYIGEAIESALAQTLAPTEIIVIDDASTDGSVAAARQHQHPSVRIVEQPRNLGGSTTVKGLQMCTGDYVAILNSDDRWDPHKLAHELDYLRRTPRCGAVFTKVTLIDESGARWRDGEHKLQRILDQPNRPRTQWLRHFFNLGNAFCASSAVVRRECFAKLGPLDGRFIQLQDLEMWVRIAASGYDLHVIEEPLTDYRVSRRLTNMSAHSDAVRAREIYEYTRLLRNLWRIETVAELAEIFPEEAWFAGQPDAIRRFVLAQVASRSPGVHHQQFAVDTMFEAAGDPACMELAARQFGFGHIQYREFMARNPLGTYATLTVGEMLKARMGAYMPPAWVETLRRTKRRLRGA